MSAVEQFEEAWADVRRLTLEFLDGVPDSRWDFSPHSRYAPFNKQVRHLICVQGCYHFGLVEQRVDFAAKHSHYSGGLDRASLRAGLVEKDTELKAILDSLRANDASSISIDFFGKARGFSRYGAIMVQHEALHHGQWSFYASLGGFETPIGWKFNWGL
jgi:hypothetical protein